MQGQQTQYERIDGRLYEWGSSEHSKAIDRLVERNAHLLAKSDFGSRFDANQTTFLARDLAYVSRDVQKVMYERLRAREFMTIKSEVPRGAETFIYRQATEIGEALVGAHLHADDAPNIDLAYEEFPHPVTHVTASYQYTVEDMEAAAFANVPLRRDKSNAAGSAIARKIDQLCRVGDARQGITGFFNNPNVPVVTLTNGEWLTATAAEIVADFNQAEQAVIAQSGDNFEGKRLILPTTYEGRLRSLARSNDSDVTVFTYLMNNARSVTSIDRWAALDDATGDDVGVSDPPQGILIDPSADNVYAEIPVPYEELPPQARGFGWVVPCRAVFAGVVFKQPLAAVYLENLD